MPKISEEIRALISNNEQLINLRNTQISELKRFATILQNTNNHIDVLPKMASKPVKTDVKD